MNQYGSISISFKRIPVIDQVFVVVAVDAHIWYLSSNLPSNGEKFNKKYRNTERFTMTKLCNERLSKVNLRNYIRKFVCMVGFEDLKDCSQENLSFAVLMTE